MTDQPDRLPSHVYVPQGQLPVPANINEPKQVLADVEPERPTKAAPRGPAWLQVFCDLPERLPVLPQEVALIRGYLPALMALIAANDNEPSRD